MRSKQRLSRILVTVVILVMIASIFVSAGALDAEIYNGYSSTELLSETQVDWQERSMQNRTDNNMTESLRVFSPNGEIERVDVPIDVFEELEASMPMPLSTFEVVPLRNNGPNNENMTVTILGDGFTATEQDSFVREAKTIANGIMDFHPFSSVQAININAIKVISNQSGASRDPYIDSPIVDNFFWEYILA